MILTRTPLRVSFAGGGTDVPPFSIQEGGAVVNAALGLYVYVLVKRRYDSSIRLSYTKTEIVETPAELEHDLVRECLLLLGMDGGLEMVTVADIPGQGSGLGSSSSLAVGLLHALHLLRGERVYQEQLAEEACEVEQVRLARPIGKQDQYAAALGGLHLLRIGPGETVRHKRLQLERSHLDYLQERLGLFWAGAPPRSETVLAEQAGRSEENRKNLLRMCKLAEWLAGQLAQEDPVQMQANVAYALRFGWERKRELAGGIATRPVDTAIEKAMAAGAWGAKLCGAGGGGYLLVCAEPEAFEPISRAMGQPLVPVRFDLQGSTSLLEADNQS